MKVSMATLRMSTTPVCKPHTRNLHTCITLMTQWRQYLSKSKKAYIKWVEPISFPGSLFFRPFLTSGVCFHIFTNGFSGLKSCLIFRKTCTRAPREEERVYEQGCGWSRAGILRSFNHNLTEW